MRAKTCENVITHTYTSVCALQGVFNKGRTGPFVESPTTRKQGERRGKVEE